MKKFLQKILIFVFISLLILTFCEITIRNIPNDYSYKKSYIEKNGETLDTIILGSSHAYYAINPEYMSKNSFSLAYTSQSLYFDNLLIHKYSKKYQNLKNIIISISYFSLSKELNSGEETWRKYDYLRYYDIGDEIIDSYDVKKYLIIPNKGIKKVLNSIIKYEIFNKDNVTCGRYGANTLNKNFRSISYLQEDALTASSRHENDSFDFRMNLSLISEVINYAKSKGINVFFVTTPYTDFYYKKLNSIKLEKINNTLDSLAIANYNVKFLNYSQDERFIYKDFNDSDHLNLLGQEKFSKILWEDIQENNAAKNKILDLITYVKDRAGHDRRYAINCDKIKNELGWTQSVDFSQGLEKTVEWYLNNTEWIENIKTGEYQKWIDKNYSGK